MNIYEYIQSLDKNDLSALLYLIYNLGIVDGFINDRSEIFTEEFMNQDKEELDKLLHVLDALAQSINTAIAN